MTKNWSTKKNDLEVAAIIINKHVSMQEDQRMSLLEFILPTETDEIYEVPDWIADITEYFVEKYGVEKGQQVANRIITKYLLADQIIH